MRSFLIKVLPVQQLKMVINTLVTIPIKLLKNLLGGNYPAFIGLASKLSIFTRHGITYFAPTWLCNWRFKTLLTKEPGTIAWIDSFEDSDVFWDIGANIGVYSIYAAMNKNINTYSFEPSPFNFNILSKNIFLNNLSSKIKTFLIALSDKTSIDYLNLSSVEEGSAHNSFKHDKNEFGKSLNVAHKQAMIGYRVDDFIKIFNVPAPSHMKIDTDGSEQVVIEGAKNTLKKESVKSILIELTTDLSGTDQDVVNLLNSYGFKLANQYNFEGIGLTNYIFRKEAS